MSRVYTSGPDQALLRRVRTHRERAIRGERFAQVADRTFGWICLAAVILGFIAALFYMAGHPA